MLYESNYYGVCDLGDSLTHHGVKGQRWGVRRYQNPDGSLTAAGKRRYFTENGQLTEAGMKEYRKDQKRLSKLKDRANVDLQKSKAEKYEKVANVAKKVGLASGAVALGAKALDSGLEGARPAIVQKFKNKLKSNDAQIADISQRLHKDTGELLRSHWSKLDMIEKQPETRASYRAFKMAEKNFDHRYGTMWNEAESARRALNANSDFLRKTASTLGKIQQGAKVAKVVSAGISAGAGATYVYSKVQANVARKRMSELGHEKAMADVNKQIDLMKNKYGSVKLSDLEKKK